MNRRSIALGALLLGAALFGAARPAAAQYALSAEQPVVGETVEITLPGPADTLRVTYRPGSRIAFTEAIPTDGKSTVQWIPARAGLVQIATADGGSRYVSVRYRSRPISGVAMMLVAGTILFGGATFAFRGLSRAPGPS